MLKFGNKEFANLQEQVAINQRAIQELKTGIKIAMAVSIDELANYVSEENLGKYFLVEQDNEEQYLYVMARNSEGIVNSYGLGKYPALGPEGPEGPEGQKGDQGRNPIIAIGSGPLPQAGDKYKFRDIYIASATGNGVVKGNVYQMNDIGRWVLQLNIVGPQGMPGQDIDEVVANPEEEAIEDIEKIKIDGVVYTIRAEDVYTKEEINSIVETIKKNAFVLVDTTEYPTLADFLATTGEDGIIYLYPVNLLDLTEGYYQYIYEANEWIQLGSTNIDLSDYAKLDTANVFSKNQIFNGHINVNNIYNLNNIVVLSLASGSGYNYLYIYNDLRAGSNDLLKLGDINNGFKELYLTKYAQYKNPGSTTYFRQEVDGNGNLIIAKSTDGTTWGNCSWYSANGNLNVAYDIVPSSDNSSNLGSSSKTFAKAYISVIENSTPSGYYHKIAMGQNMYIGYFTGSDVLVGYNIKFSGAQTEIYGLKKFEVDADNNANIGTSTKRVKDFYLAGNISDGTNNVTVAQLKKATYSTVPSGNVGSITSTAITTGWYRHTIAISGGVLDNAIDVRVKVQYLDGNNQTVVVNYPAILNNKTELVIFSGLDLQTEGAVVSAVYYRTA